jgi:hypothetical protein
VAHAAARTGIARLNPIILACGERLHEPLNRPVKP